MIHSALYVLLIISLVNGVPESYYESLTNFSNWISPSSNSGNEVEFVENIETVEKEKKPDDSKRRVIDESEIDVEVVNPNETMAVGDLLDKIKNEATETSVDDKKEIVGVLEQLKNAVVDDSMRRVKVLYKGFWHAVDLGIVGSSQRKRDAEKAVGIIESLKQLWTSLMNAFWRILGYTDEENKKNEDEDDDDDEGKKKEQADKNKDITDKDKDKEKNKSKDTSKDGTDKNKKINGDKDTTPLVKDDKSDESSDKVDVVLKPLANTKDAGPSAHTSSNGKLSFDTQWKDGIDGVSKPLSELSSILGDKLMTREEVDKELEEAKKINDVNNRFYKRVLSSREVMKDEKDEREWPEDKALKKLDEMNADFEKTTDKTQMKKDVLSLSMQPLYYAETYDKIMDLVDRLQESGVPGKDLRAIRNLLFEQKSFSLEHSIQETPKKKYQIERRKKIEETAKKEKAASKDNRDWNEAQVLDRIEEIDKNFETETPEKEKNLKDLASICMQPPSYTFETYEKIQKLINKLKESKKVTSDELENTEDALLRKLKFTYLDTMLQISQMQEHEKFKLQEEKAKDRREKHKDTREFTEEQALPIIDDLNKNFESKDKTELVKDVTNLSMQPFYKVETYDKLEDLVEKLKNANIPDKDTQLKPAIDSLKEEKAFSSQHNLRAKPKDSFAEKLYNLKHKYIKPGVDLNVEQKKALFNDLEFLRTENPTTEEELKDALSLIKAVRGAENAVEPAKVQELYQQVVQKVPDKAVKSPAESEKKKNFPLGRTVKTTNLTGEKIDLEKFITGKEVNGVLSAA